MTRGRRTTWLPQFSDDIQGPRRKEIIEEHLRWQEHRHLEQPRDLSDYPLAQWLAERRRSLALRRSETLASNYRNTKNKRAKGRTPRS